MTAIYLVSIICIHTGIMCHDKGFKQLTIADSTMSTYIVQSYVYFIIIYNIYGSTTLLLYDIYFTQVI